MANPGVKRSVGPYELNRIHIGDSQELVKALPDESIHCLVTSPPYWGLRDYGVGGQIGGEETSEEYVQTIVGLFQDLRRALRKDGTCWLVLGDSYHKKSGELPRKNLVGIPWRVALALQADGWWLRSAIIWSKPNAMPESVKDRPTKAYEYVFLLTKSLRYFYDAEAVKEKSSTPPHKARYKDGEKYATGPMSRGGNSQREGDKERLWGADGRNCRNVWEIPTQPFPDPHYAVFPPKLVEPCILAGCSSKVCAKCGAPWKRVTEVVGYSHQHTGGEDQYHNQSTGDHGKNSSFTTGLVAQRKTVGYRPTCRCDAGTTKSVVLDPFIGSGTTACVATEKGRDWLGFDISEEYKQMAYGRIAQARMPIPGLEQD